MKDPYLGLASKDPYLGLLLLFVRNIVINDNVVIFERRGTFLLTIMSFDALMI